MKKSCITKALAVLFTPLLFCAAAMAQTQLIDSLKKDFYNAGNLAQKKLALIPLLDQNQSMPLDTFKSYLNTGEEFTGMQKDVRYSLQIALVQCRFLSRNGKLDAALEMADSCLKRIPDPKAEFELTRKFIQMKGGLYMRKNNQQKAMTQFYEILRLAEELKDTLAAAQSKNGIGWGYMELGQNREALRWFFASLNTPMRPEWLKRFGVTYSNMAAVYNELHQNDSAEYYIRKAIFSTQQEQNLSFVANCYYILSDIMMDEKKIDSAADALKKGIQIRKQIGDPLYIISDLTQLALFYASNNQPQKGIAASKEGIAIAQQYSMLLKLPILYDALAKNYKAAGDKENYATTLNTIIELKDSLYSNNSPEALAEMQSKYELQKKELTNIKQQNEITKQNYIFYGSLAAFALVALLGFTNFVNYRRKQKLKMQLMQEGEKRRAEIAVTEAEEKERRRIAADLHDNLGAYANAVLYNTELLAQEINIAERNELMEDLKYASKDIISSLRETIWALKKDNYSSEDCMLRIRNFMQSVGRYYSDINFKVEGDSPAAIHLNASKALHLVRMVQEAVTNAIKHAGAKNITVSSNAENDHWKLTIADDGSGFDYEASKNSQQGNGLENIVHRAEESGFKVTVKAEKGTEVVIEVM